MDKLLDTYPWMKPERLVADIGYDSVHNHQLLLNKGILPIIHIRKPPNGALHMDAYTPIGEPVCMGGKAMEYLRTDKDTGKHLYRCPASACARKSKIKGWSTCLDEVWEDPKENLRVVARASDEWKALYKMRPIIERSFRSLKHSRLLDRYYYLESAKVERHIGLSILTYGLTMLIRALGRSCGICGLDCPGREHLDAFKPYAEIALFSSQDGLD